MAEIKRWSIKWDDDLKKFVPVTGPGYKKEYTISEARRKCKELNRKDQHNG